MVLVYEKEYFNQCVELYLDVFMNSPWDFKWMDKNKIENYFHDMENTPQFNSYIYVEKNKVKAICFGIVNNYFYEDSYHIKEFIVSRNSQGKGYGTALLNYVENHMKQQNIKLITLLTQNQIQAYDFYIKNNYKVAPSTIYMTNKVE